MALNAEPHATQVRKDASDLLSALQQSLKSKGVEIEALQPPLRVKRKDTPSKFARDNNMTIESQGDFEDDNSS